MKRFDILFLAPHHVVRMHDLVTEPENGGGDKGVRDPGMVESPVMAVQNSYAGSLAELAAEYGDGIANGHAYVDGNKRTAAEATLTFLELNGFPLVVDEGEWAAHFVAVSSGKMSRRELAAQIAAELGKLQGAAGPIWVDFEPDDDEGPRSRPG